MRKLLFREVDKGDARMHGKSSTGTELFACFFYDTRAAIIFSSFRVFFLWRNVLGEPRAMNKRFLNVLHRTTREAGGR